MRDITVVLDLQYGSTGKGQIAGTFGHKWGADTVVCANMPNAGHTYRWTERWDGSDVTEQHKVMHTVMPVGAVLPSVRNILIGPGAVIDIAQLEAEIKHAAPWLTGKRLIIHPNAGVVTNGHRQAEQQLVRVGSTMKGSAEAVIEKMRRGKEASIARNYRMQLEAIYTGHGLNRFLVSVDSAEYDAAIDSSDRLLVEGAQGASLSIHSQFYPYTTSRDVGLAQVWADCRLPAVSPWKMHSNNMGLRVIGTCRTFPIRVANRFDENGRQIGTSGPHYSDQQELDWARDLGREPELTTVTKLPRRIFSFSTLQIMESARYCAPTTIALTFCDYLDPRDVRTEVAVAGKTTMAGDVRRMVRRIEAAAGVGVEFLSYGPMDVDVYQCDGDVLRRLV